VGDQDSQITYLQESSNFCCSEFGPFTSADFLAARTGPHAYVRPVYSGWIAGLTCDPTAQWISESAANDSHTSLYAISFDVATCCIAHAELTFCWAADDSLGGATYNTAGVYLNELPLNSISGGGPGVETSVGPVDVSSLVHCGSNTLYVYDHDTAWVISGVLFNAEINITECATPTELTTWSTIKAMYH